MQNISNYLDSFIITTDIRFSIGIGFSMMKCFKCKP